MTIQESLEKVILNEIAGGLGKKSLDPDENLLEQGIIDSLGLMKLVVYMEEHFDMEVPDEEIVPENFQSLNSVATFIKQQMQDR